MFHQPYTHSQRAPVDPLLSTVSKPSMSHQTQSIPLTMSIHLAIHLSTAALASSTNPNSVHAVSCSSFHYIYQKRRKRKNSPRRSCTPPRIPDSNADAIQACVNDVCSPTKIN